MTLEIATAEHTHAHEDVCTSACPASPWFEPVPPAEEMTIAFLAGKVDALAEQVKLLTAQQENIATMLATVVDQVGPTLDKLTDHPMLKMFLGGK